MILLLMYLAQIHYNYAKTPFGETFFPLKKKKPKTLT